MLAAITQKHAGRCFGLFDGPKQADTTPIMGSLRSRPTAVMGRRLNAEVQQAPCQHSNVSMTAGKQHGMRASVPPLVHHLLLHDRAGITPRMPAASAAQLVAPFSLRSKSRPAIHVQAWPPNSLCARRTARWTPAGLLTSAAPQVVIHQARPQSWACLPSSPNLPKPLVS